MPLNILYAGILLPILMFMTYSCWDILSSHTLTLSSMKVNNEKLENNPNTICKILSKDKPSEDCEDNGTKTCHPNPRIVVIGDVHGSYDGMMEILYKAGITKSLDECKWKKSPVLDKTSDVRINNNNTILLQIGDIVDRGAGASESWSCLQKLQRTAPGEARVIRLIGNHELWWLSGYFKMINRQADTQERVLRLVEQMKSDILKGQLIGAYTLSINGFPILFTHAGIRPAFFEYLKKGADTSSPIVTPEEIVKYINEKLVADTLKCQNKWCKFEDELYDAGPDRYGDGIGGPLWTDFKVLCKADDKDLLPSDMMQIVGHTASHCDLDDSDCIRASSKLSAICVDGGMYLGSRSFLEISPSGYITAHQKMSNGSWKEKQQTKDLCE